MEPQAVFESLGTGRCRAAPAWNAGEIDFDASGFGGRRARGRPEPCEESASIADEHTNAAAHESTWFDRKMLGDLRAVEASAQGRQFPGRKFRADTHFAVTTRTTPDSRGVILRRTDAGWLRVGIEEIAGERQTCRAPRVRQVSELADTNEPSWQDVLGEPAQELVCGNGHLALLVAMRVVFPAESDILAVEGE